MWAEDFASGVKQAYLNGGWGNLWFRQRSRTHYPPASVQASIPQRRQLVRNSFRLPLSHFHECDSSTTPTPSFPLCLHSVFGSALSPFPGALVSSSCSDGIVCLYLSASIATTAAVKGNETQVLSTPLCLFSATLCPVTSFILLSWLLLTYLLICLWIFLAPCCPITCHLLALCDLPCHLEIFLLSRSAATIFKQAWKCMTDICLTKSLLSCRRQFWNLSATRIYLIQQVTSSSHAL